MTPNVVDYVTLGFFFQGGLKYLKISEKGFDFDFAANTQFFFFLLSNKSKLELPSEIIVLKLS